MMTSSISPGATLARLTASAIACPAKACGWVSLKAPRNARPIGVRAVETMTARRMGVLLLGLFGRRLGLGGEDDRHDQVAFGRSVLDIVADRLPVGAEIKVN